MPFQLISPEHHNRVIIFVDDIPNMKQEAIAAALGELIQQIQANIPKKHRISTGRYSIVKALGKELFPLLEGSHTSVGDFADGLFYSPGADPFVRSLALQLLALQGVSSAGPEDVLHYFEKAAADSDWILRECASGLVRVLIKTYPQLISDWYLELVQSPDPHLRRFVSESLRPVVENRWFHADPEYALGVIRHLFRESTPYPRTSVGNNLSDWMRVDRDTTWPIVVELVKNGDKNSYWIAYRACRNLVKTEPRRVLQLLGVKEYKYKKRVHRLPD